METKIDSHAYFLFSLLSLFQQILKIERVTFSSTSKPNDFLMSQNDLSRFKTYNCTPVFIFNANLIKLFWCEINLNHGKIRLL